MSKRTIADCDNCGNDNLREGKYAEIEVDTSEYVGTIDLCTSCVGDELQAVVRAMTPEQLRSFIEGINFSRERSGRPRLSL